MTARFWETDSLQVVPTPLDEVSRHPDNANQGDSEALRESIAVNGFYSPIVVQASTGYILAGNHRWEAALALGAETIPTIFIDVDDDRAKRIMLADNRITRLGRDDPGDLAALLNELSEHDYGLMGTGFSSNDHRMLLESLDMPLEFDDMVDEASGVPAEDPETIGMEVSPTTDAEGTCIALRITREDGMALTAAQFQSVRERLGLNRLAPGVIRAYRIEGWVG